MLKYIPLLSFVAIGLSLVTLGVAVFLWVQANKKEPLREPPVDVTIKTTESAREQVTMMDNSKIWLNTGSELRYMPDYRVERRAQLTGQAYLKVKTLERLFTLDVNGMKLYTYGASFWVDSYPEKETARIVLYSGVLHTQWLEKKQAVAMRAGTELMLNKKTGEFEVSRVKSGVKGPEWIVHRFEYTAFDNILYTISQYYEVSVNNNRPDLNNEPFTLTFEGHMTLDEVMQILKTVSNQFTYRIEGSELIIN